MARTSTTRSKGNGPGKGTGWGGPAKGMPARAEKAPPFEPGNQAAAGPHEFSKSERIARHIASLERIAAAAEAEGRYNEAITATTHALNRLEGLPVARNINVTAGDVKDLSDEALLQVIHSAAEETKLH
jgi:hypothetical protein